jgi:hypothetical protein
MSKGLRIRLKGVVMFNDLYTHCDFHFLGQEIVHRNLPITKEFGDGATGHLIYQGQFSNSDEHKFSYVDFKGMKASEHKSALKVCHSRLKHTVEALLKENANFIEKKEKRRLRIIAGIARARAIILESKLLS